LGATLLADCAPRFWTVTKVPSFLATYDVSGESGEVFLLRSRTVLEQVFTGLSAVSALVAAVLWIVASRAEVPAPPGTAGVGGLVGGYLIGLNAKGQRIDLVATPAKQSLWNSRAASAAAITAALGLCSQIAHMIAMSQ
jgi:hypothetical protein